MLLFLLNSHKVLLVHIRCMSCDPLPFINFSSLPRNVPSVQPIDYNHLSKRAIGILSILTENPIRKPLLPAR